MKPVESMLDVSHILTVGELPIFGDEDLPASLLALAIISANFVAPEPPHHIVRLNAGELVKHY